MKFTEHTRIRQERFGAVVFDTLREKVFVTNETGAEILRLIGEGKELTELTEILGDVYTESPDLIASDINGFVKELEENRIIEYDTRR